MGIGARAERRSAMHSRWVMTMGKSAAASVGSREFAVRAPHRRCASVREERRQQSRTRAIQCGINPCFGDVCDVWCGVGVRTVFVVRYVCPLQPQSAVFTPAIAVAPCWRHRYLAAALLP